MRHATRLFPVLALLLAAPASAGRFAAVWDAAGPEPAGKATADCRVENEYAACGTVFWSFGGWCVDDEVTTYFDMPNDPCLGGCPFWNGWGTIESAEVGLRVVGTTCNGGYPITTYPMEAVSRSL